VGMVIDTEGHGKVRIIEVKENPSWGATVIIYLDQYGPENAIGRFVNDGGLPGGAVLVEQVSE
ncbi:hypothetical protein KIH86_27815, partial [Paenibacillus sp. HN-1]